MSVDGSTQLATPMYSLRRARRGDARLVPVAALAWVAAGIGTSHADLALAAAIALWCGALGALLVGVRAVTAVPGVRRSGVWAMIAVCLAAAAAVCTHVAVAEPSRAIVRALDVSGGRTLIVEVTAVGKIERSASGWRFDASLHRAWLGPVETEPQSFGAGVPVLVRIDDAPTDLDLGARVRMRATAWPTDPGQRAVLVVDAAAEPEILAPASGVLAVAAALRRGLVASSAALPQPGGGLIAGLAVGDTSAVGAELDAAMKTSSLSHLTAVSGANCALIVAFAFGGAALLRARRGIRVASGLAALTAFVILVSPEPSVVRAAAMAAIAMLGVLLGRPGAGLSLLTTAVIVLLIVDPWLALSLGFALSVAATAALLVGAGPLADGLARWMPRPLALAIAVPLAAQLACGPLLVLISPQVSVYGVVANLLAAPAAPAGTVVGLAACLAAGVPALGSGLVALAWVPAAWIAATAETFAALPGTVIAWSEGPIGLVGLVVVGGALAVVIAPAHARARATGILVLSAALGVGIALGPVHDAVRRAQTPTGWSIVACDVGQGDAVLVRSAQHVALIDTGPAPEPLSSCLDDLGIDQIDLLVLTHFDLDHRGGVQAVLGRVDTVLHGPTADEADVRVLARLEASGAHLVSAVRGVSGSLGDARWRTLWPRSDALGGNDASVIVDVTGGGVPASLFLGDLSAAGQQGMASGALLRSSYDVVKIAHHGSADQDPALYARVHPTLALVTVGENDYGHPRAETLEMIAALGTRIARTDRDGMIAVWRDSDGLRLWHERSGVSGDG